MRARVRGSIPIVALILVASLAIWETVAALVQHERAPTDDQWRAAAEQLRTQWQAGDAVVIAPSWAEPVGHQHLAELFTLDMASLSDIDRFRRVWELSIRGVRHHWLQQYRPTKTSRHGAVTLSLYNKQAQQVVFDFTANIARARVQLLGDRLRSCRWDGQRFGCSRRGWNWVGKHLAEVAYRPYRCIYAHPAPQQRLLITFANVRLGNTLVGYTGIDDFDARKASTAPVLLQTYIDNRMVSSILHQNDWPWTRFEINTSEFAGHNHRLRFEVSAEQTYKRPFCFHMEARARSGAKHE